MNKLILAVLTTALFVTSVYAQMPGPPGLPHGPGLEGNFGPGGFRAGMHPGRVVTNAPYTATATDNFSQTLANGNTIQRTTTATVARDNSGRTYEQETITGGPLAGSNGPTTITFITDPVAGYSYVLNASTKIATRRPIHAPGAADKGPGGGFARNRPNNPNITESSLTPTTMNGVNVTGKTITHTIPAGEIGNAQPITSTSTVWFSPDLQVVVSATRNDPRTGTSTYALTNIQRTDPPAALFQVPSDYTIQDAKGPAWGQRPPRQ